VTACHEAHFNYQGSGGVLPRDERGNSLLPEGFLLWVEATESGNLSLILDRPYRDAESRRACELLAMFPPLKYSLLQRLQGAMQRQG
jgi:hypothetical protein